MSDRDQVDFKENTIQGEVDRDFQKNHFGANNGGWALLLFEDSEGKKKAFANDLDLVHFIVGWSPKEGELFKIRDQGDGWLIEVEGIDVKKAAEKGEERLKEKKENEEKEENVPDRQKSIQRQSSLKAALHFLEICTKDIDLSPEDEEDVIPGTLLTDTLNVAEVFEEWIGREINAEESD